MMLVQKQPNLPVFALSSPLSHHHRRHPSAPPAVVVQPTRTPGLLSLSKPQQPRQQLQQHRQPRSTPKPKQLAASNRPPRTTTPPPDVASTLPQDKSQGTRGRKSAKDKAARRTNSHSSVRGRRIPRQPSPPQAEGPQTPTNLTFPVTSNFFDPFLDDSSFSPPKQVSQIRTPPTLASRPTGKLAKRRQPTPSTPTPVVKSKAVSVPVPIIDPKRSTFSRSVPTTKWDNAFPICDDLTDAGDNDDSTTSPPSTPVRRKSKQSLWIYDDGPRTAPLSSTSLMFPFSSPSPSPHAHRTPSPVMHKTRPRQHKRVPSEGVFHMSSDDESIPTSRLGRSESAERERYMDEKAAIFAAGYFASSMFQNSPSPEELPPPTFV